MVINNHEPKGRDKEWLPCITNHKYEFNAIKNKSLISLKKFQGELIEKINLIIILMNWNCLYNNQKTSLRKKPKNFKTPTTIGN